MKKDKATEQILRRSQVCNTSHPLRCRARGPTLDLGQSSELQKDSPGGGMQRQVPSLPQPDMQMLEVLPSFAPALAIPLTHRQFSLYPGHSYTF